MGGPTRLVTGRGTAGPTQGCRVVVSSAGLPGDSLGLWNLAGVRYGSPYCRTGAVVNRMTNG